MDLQNLEIKSELSLITQQNSLFKIFGSKVFTFQKAYAKSLVDWSGFYTQLSPDHSMRYLTKKWDDGAEQACLVLIKSIRPIKILKICCDQFFSNAKISGQEKARQLKAHLKTKSEQMSSYRLLKIEENDILLEQLGKRQTLLQCIDADDKQIIIPHEMLNQNNFSFTTLISFKRSNDGMLRTIVWKFASQALTKQQFFQKIELKNKALTNQKEQHQQIAESQNWRKVSSQCQFQPYLILKQEPQIGQMLFNMKLIQ